jgi:DNA-binding response OmpR family regulator
VTEPRTVAIIDDSALVLSMACDALQEAGYKVRPVTGASEAEELENVHLIPVDAQMPELFGDDLAMVLRLARGFKCPIYLYSSLDRDDLEKRANKAGLDGFICRNEGLEHLVERVRSILPEAA